METMKVHVLERALTAACIIAAIAVVLWGFKIMAAWTSTYRLAPPYPLAEGWRAMNLWTASLKRGRKDSPRSIEQGKIKILVDADSALTHLGESRRQIIASTECCCPVLT
jgi:hypothetical protein